MLTIVHVGWQIALKLTFRTFDGLFGDLLKNLENSKRLLLVSADVAHFQETNKFFHEMYQARLQERESFKRQQEEDARERLLTVLDWLLPTSQTNLYNELQQQREEFPGTTNWIFSHDLWK